MQVGVQHLAEFTFGCGSHFPFRDAVVVLKKSTKLLCDAVTPI